MFGAAKPTVKPLALVACSPLAGAATIRLPWSLGKRHHILQAKRAQRRFVKTAGLVDIIAAEEHVSEHLFSPGWLGMAFSLGGAAQERQ
jgi:hypothetical protein